MGEQSPPMLRIGTCDLCGGDVIGFRGTWVAMIPPPTDSCSNCRATRASDIVEMKNPQLPEASVQTPQILDSTIGM